MSLFSLESEAHLKNLILCVLAQVTLLGALSLTASAAEQELNICNLEKREEFSRQKQPSSPVNQLQLPVPVQGSDKGCCVLKQGQQPQWRYFYTSRDNCARTAQNLGAPYAFHKDRRCEDVPK